MQKHAPEWNRKGRRSVKHRLRERIPSKPPQRPQVVPTGRTVLVESSHAERRRERREAAERALAKSSESPPPSGTT